MKLTLKTALVLSSLFVTVAAQAECPPLTADMISSIKLQDVKRTIRKAPHYTQGLIFHEGSLYESTGLKGYSSIYKTDAASGEQKKLADISAHEFGEGIALLNDKLYQLTWQDEKAYVYDFKNGEIQASNPPNTSYKGEGWGLTTLGAQLVLSNGSNELQFIDPATFEVKNKVAVFVGQTPIKYLNEIETIGDHVWGNRYGTSQIFEIGPQDGCVTRLFETKELVEDARAILTNEGISPELTEGSDSSHFIHYVANGIAYDAAKSELYITGKNWPVIYVFDWKAAR